MNWSIALTEWFGVKALFRIQRSRGVFEAVLVGPSGALLEDCWEDLCAAAMCEAHGPAGEVFGRADARTIRPPSRLSVAA